MNVRCDQLTTVLPFTIAARGSEIALSGDLDDSKAVRDRLYAVFSKVGAEKGELLIDATGARVTPGGINAWAAAVRENLKSCHIAYGPSQLALILQYDDDYDHPDSSFCD